MFLTSLHLYLIFGVGNVTPTTNAIAIKTIFNRVPLMPWDIAKISNPVMQLIQCRQFSNQSFV